MTSGSTEKPAHVADLIRPDRYPLSSKYHPAWVLSLDMGARIRCGSSRTS
jgi:hypothetical protein